MPNTCPPNTILREGYTKKNGTRVHSTCIKDVGKSGKTPKNARLPTPSDDLHLSKYGYDVHASNEKRNNALANAVLGIEKEKKITRKDAVRKILRHLNLLSILQRNTNPKISAILKKDSEKMSRILNMMS